ncbi:MAG TPA: DUF1579 family protein [Candidatus Acidoferrum sp.]|nr:DUF1579 family protein [Candidatus Acidoferrum sp.]
MKKNRRNALTAALVTLSFAVCAHALSIRQQKSESKQELASKTAPEMQRLNFYLGEWDYTETYPKSAAFPDGATNTGVYTSKSGPGGNSLINSFHSKGPAGEFEGLLVITWDPRENAYKSYVFGDGFPGALVETGQFEGDALVFRTEFTAGGATVKLRNATRVLSSGKLVSEQYSARNGAPERLFVSVEAKKR